jgi:signal transduction histidine kinase
MIRTPEAILSDSVFQDVSIDLADVIRNVSLEFAGCRDDDFPGVARRAVAAFAASQHADLAGWFSLSFSGDLIPIYRADPQSEKLLSLLPSGLRGFTECSSQLFRGNSVLLCKVGEYRHATHIACQMLTAAGIAQCALFPSGNASADRTVLILATSNSPVRPWSVELTQQGALFANILSSTYRRLRAERNLDMGKMAFERLFAMVPGALSLINSEGRFIAANVAFLNLVNYSLEELVMMKYSQICVTTSSRGQAKVFPLWAGGRHGVPNADNTQRLLRRDKSSFHAHVTNLGKVGWPGSATDLSMIAVEDLTHGDQKDDELRQRRLEVDELASHLIQSQENERKHLSRELHDDIGQRLSLIASEAALMTQRSSMSSPESSARLETLRDELDSLCSDVHTLSHNLHSYKLQHLGLRSALNALRVQYQQPEFGVDLQVDDFEEPQSKDVSLCLYRVAQEAFANAFKHSRAASAALIVTRLDDRFYMAFQDSGVGFDLRKRPEGLGLISMNERVKLVGGEFRVNSRVGRGTEIWVSIPDSSNPVRSDAA